MKAVTFKVTKESLKESVEAINAGKTVHRNCAIALVVGKQYLDFSCGVTTGRIPGVEELIAIPGYVSNYIQAFDNLTAEERLELQEFEFTLDMPY